MVSTALTWFGVTKPLFDNKKRLKVSAQNYRKHLKKELFPAINKIYPRKDWIFIQDCATSHTSDLVQDCLKEAIRDVPSKKISGLQNHQTAILWIITSGIRLRRKYIKTD